MSEPADRLRLGVSVGALAVVVGVPSFEDFGRHLPGLPWAPYVWVLVTAILASATLTLPGRSASLQQVLRSPLLTAVLLVAMTVTGAVLFERQFGRDLNGTGSTLALAMSSPVHAFVAGHGLYGAHLPGGAPVSPGPAWILFNSPFTLAHAFWLFVSAWVVVTALVLRRTYGHGLEVNLGLTVLGTSPHFLHLVSAGADVIPVGCALVLLVVGADRLVPRAGPWPALIGLGAGILATSRVIYLGIPLLIGLLVWRRSRPAAAVIAGVGVTFALTSEILVAALGTSFPPMHLFDRASTNQPASVVIVGVVVSLAVFGLAIRRVTADLRSWMIWTALCFSVPHVFIGLGELETSPHIAAWEGSNYLLVCAIPVVVAVFAARRATAACPAVL
ncbi:MAG: hypothetical protein M3Y36_01360 [Actinomycetota bacterium]|nr:hypothetical protein [Actinomycetota bacterium]